MSSGTLLITQGLGSPIIPLAVVPVDVQAHSVSMRFSVDITLTEQSAFLDKWSITSASGTNPIKIVGWSYTGNTVTFTVTEHQNNGSYTVNVPYGVVAKEDGRLYTGPFEIPYTGVGYAPYVIAVRGIDQNTVEVVFSEPVLESTASDPANYSITSPIKVLEAKKVTDIVYRLRTTPMQVLSQYELVATGVRDLASTPIGPPP